VIRRFKWWEPKYPNVHWTDPVTGYEIQVRFNENGGTWCGYVVLPEDHPWVSDPSDTLDFSVVYVHGGWTYRDGRTFGFDCAHYMDYQPQGYYRYAGTRGEPLTYWTFAMVRDEILRAAREIHALR
jgi:hypothetical protein